MSTPPIPSGVSGTQVILQGVSSGAGASGATNIPPGILALPNGTLVRGNIVQTDSQSGLATLRTPKGDISLKSELQLERGHEVVIRLDTASAGLKARIISVDGLTPKELAHSQRLNPNAQNIEDLVDLPDQPLLNTGNAKQNLPIKAPPATLPPTSDLADLPVLDSVNLTPLQTPALKAALLSRAPNLPELLRVLPPVIAIPRQRLEAGANISITVLTDTIELPDGSNPSPANYIAPNNTAASPTPATTTQTGAQNPASLIAAAVATTQGDTPELLPSLTPSQPNNTTSANNPAIARFVTLPTGGYAPNPLLPSTPTYTLENTANANAALPSATQPSSSAVNSTTTNTQLPNIAAPNIATPSIQNPSSTSTPAQTAVPSTAPTGNNSLSSALGNITVGSVTTPDNSAPTMPTASTTATTLPPTATSPANTPATAQANGGVATTTPAPLLLPNATATAQTQPLPTANLATGESPAVLNTNITLNSATTTTPVLQPANAPQSASASNNTIQPSQTPITTTANTPSTTTSVPPVLSSPYDASAESFIAKGQLPAQVIGTEQSGEMVLKTPFGTVKVDLMLANGQRMSLPTDSKLTLQLLSLDATDSLAGVPLSTSSTPASLGELSQQWSSLRDVATLLQQTNPLVAQYLMQNIIPQAGPKMAKDILFFILGLKTGEVGDWLDKKTIESLEQQQRGDLVRKLSAEFGTLKQFYLEPPSPNWQAVFVPVHYQGEWQQNRLFIKKDSQDGSKSADEAVGTRFIMEVELSKLGAMQFDGFIKKHPQTTHFDLVIRSAMAFPAKDQQAIRSIFTEASELTGFKGGISFQVGQPFPILPLEEVLKPDRNVIA